MIKSIKFENSKKVVVTKPHNIKAMINTEEKIFSKTVERQANMLFVTFEGDDFADLQSRVLRSLASEEVKTHPDFVKSGLDPTHRVDTVPVTSKKDGSYTKSKYRITYKFKAL